MEENVDKVQTIEEHITPDVVQELTEIQLFIDSEYTEDVAVLIPRLTRIGAYMSRTGYLKAVAESDRDRAMAAVFSEHSKAILKMPATVSTKFIGSQCARENYYCTWIDRINRTCTHQADIIRTQISFAKEDLALTRRGY